MVKAWDSKSLDCSRSQIRIRDVVEFLLIPSLFLLFFLLHSIVLIFVVFWLVFAKRSFASV